MYKGRNHTVVKPRTRKVAPTTRFTSIALDFGEHRIVSLQNSLQ
jgi:hypothetical protein